MKKEISPSKLFLSTLTYALSLLPILALEIEEISRFISPLNIPSVALTLPANTEGKVDKELIALAVPCTADVSSFCICK